MRFQFGSAPNENYTDGVTVVAPIYGVFDAAANDSDKSFTVPDGEMWKLMYANVKLVTSADVGNRQIRFSVTDPDGNDVGYISAGAVQVASTTRSYGFLQGIYRETAFIDSMIQIPIPVDLYLPAGSTIRFYDSAAIAAAADDMTVSFGVQRFKGC
jgi:hypothetical protein